MLGLLLSLPTAFVAPIRSARVPTRAAVRLESEMDYLKRRADEKGENGGGWSIFKPQPKDAKPDPPWLVAAKQRSDQRAERTGRTKDDKSWWKGADYSDEDSEGLPVAPRLPWFKRMESTVEESPAEESSTPATETGAEESA